MIHELDRSARAWAMACHVMGFALYVLPPVGHIVLVLVVWLLKKEDSRFVEDHGREALNLQISMTLYFIIALLLTTVWVGLFLLPVLMMAHAGLMIYAAIAAMEGASFRYPLIFRPI